MKNLKKKSVKTGCFQGLIVTSHLSILPIVLILALSPSPFLLHSLSPVLWSSFSLRQKTAQDPSFLFFFPLAATGFSYSKESLLQLMSFSLAVTLGGSVVVAGGLRCPKACGILVSWPGMEPMSPALEGGFLTTEPPGKVSQKIFMESMYSFLASGSVCSLWASICMQLCLACCPNLRHAAFCISEIRICIKNKDLIGGGYHHQSWK